MNASLEWLRAFVDLPESPADVRDLLTEHTATVEDLVPLRSDLAAIVVARVVEAARHPDSDHLWATKVDAGGPDLLDVICGATNVTAGKQYPFAPVGTTMPNGMKIERRKIRGIASNGMLCSARELGLGDNHEGILELDVASPPGTPFLRAMPIGDTRLVVDVGANRPDLLSHLGLARELGAVTGRPWKLPDLPNAGPEPTAPQRSESPAETAGVTVRVDAETNTRRYMGAVITGVSVGPSPAWLVQRLAAVDVRSINNVVDATNYVLHELGQPVHAFDLEKLGRDVRVRLATKGERVTTLDGALRELPPNAVVIAGSREVQAVAGVMGARDSEVTQATRDLFIEVASFDPKRTRAARKAIGLATDASYRFERGVDPELASVALDRVIRLITGVAGGILAGAPLDFHPSRTPAPEVRIRMRRVHQVLGARVPPTDAKAYLQRAGFEVVASSDEDMRVRVPSWRTDVFEEIDLVEEIARFHGYDRFPTEIRPFRPTSTTDDPLWVTASRLRDAMIALGLFEARPMPFVAGAEGTHVRVANPLSENEAYLRTSLLDTLGNRAEFNLSHRNGDVRLFEIGSAFAPAATGMPVEECRLAALVMGRRRPPHFGEAQPASFDEWDAKWIAECAARAAYPGQSVQMVPDSGATLWQMYVGGETVGRVMRLALDAPVWAGAAFGIELRLGVLDATAPSAPGTHSYKEGRAGKGSVTAHAPVTRYRALPNLPAAEFDLALVVPNATPAAEVERTIRESAGELLERLELFDEYTGTGIAERHRSLAWRLTFRHPERTLREKEIDARRSKILSVLEQELHVRQRTT